jgi:hypothetical protein
MESLFPHAKKGQGMFASRFAAAANAAAASSADADGGETPSILNLVTNGEFSAVGQPAASGTCASVHQALVAAVAETEAAISTVAAASPCKLCLQSAQVEADKGENKRLLPERFTTMEEVSIRTVFRSRSCIILAEPQPLEPHQNGAAPQH